MTIEMDLSPVEHETTSPPPETPGPPTIFQRLGIVRDKRKDSALEVYRRHVHMLASGGELGDKDAEQLADVMQALKRDDDRLQADVEVVRRQLVDAPRDRNKLARLEQAYGQTKREYDAQHDGAVRAAERDRTLFAKQEALAAEVRFHREHVTTLHEEHRRQHADLFAD